MRIDRRGFLKTAMAGTAGLSLPFVALAGERRWIDKTRETHTNRDGEKVFA